MFASSFGPFLFLVAGGSVAAAAAGHSSLDALFDATEEVRLEVTLALAALSPLFSSKDSSCGVLIFKSSRDIAVCVYRGIKFDIGKMYRIMV